MRARRPRRCTPCRAEAGREAERPLRITGARGAVRASAIYPSPSLYHARLRVTDGGRRVLDTVVADLPMAFQFADLEGTGSVLLFDGFTGGAHCCFDTTIVRLGSGEGRVTRVDWGDAGYSLLRSGSGTGYVFRTGDKDMAYAFSSFAASTFSIKVVALRKGVIRDVTGDYPALIERDAHDQWATYLKRKHDPRDRPAATSCSAGRKVPCGSALS